MSCSRLVVRFALLVFPLILITSIPSTAEVLTEQTASVTDSVLYSEDFESGSSDWSDPSGVWEVGIPTAGPSSARGGQHVAGTNLDGNYPGGCNAYFTSPEIPIPDPQTLGFEQIHLEFWQWIDIYKSNDYADLAQIRISRDGEPSQILFGTLRSKGSGWTRFDWDLSEYAGSTVRISLRMWDDSHYDFYGNPTVSRGFYVDDVKVLARSVSPWNTEDFEDGAPGWSAFNGVWQVGWPESGPSQPYRGAGCVGTALTGNYPLWSSATLISPKISLSALPTDGRIWLRFWHWFQLHSPYLPDTDGDDRGHVSVLFEDGSRERISPYYELTSSCWSPALLDLSPYQGQVIQLLFVLESDGTYDGGGHATNYPGWYVDHLQLFEGALDFSSPMSFDDGFWKRPVLDGWSASNGVWECGVPTAGPDLPFEGAYCFGTDLDGDYSRKVDSSLVSPPIHLPATPIGNQLWLTYQSWYDLYPGDWARVEITTDGGSSWGGIGATHINGSGAWTQVMVDLLPYADQTVQFGFRLHDDGLNASHVARGWYVDDIGVVEGPRAYSIPESFEGGSRGWATTGGNWEIRESPDCFSGARCLGTVFGGNYTRYADAAVTTPPIQLPASAPSGVHLTFYQRFSLYEVADQVDRAEINVLRAGSDPELIAEYHGDSGGWVSEDIELFYPGEEIQLEFRLIDDSTGEVGGAEEGLGWYIDDVDLVGLPSVLLDPPTALDVSYSAGAPVVSWQSPAYSYDWIAVYASRDSLKPPSLAHRVALVPASPYLPNELAGWDFHFTLTGLTTDGHESALAWPTTVVAVEDCPLLPRSPLLEKNYPNPFNPRTTISFTLPEECRARMTIYDVKGRRVRRLLDDTLAAGPHEIPWDGMDDSGIPVASGVYRCELRACDSVQARPMALLR